MIKINETTTAISNPALVILGAGYGKRFRASCGTGDKLETLLEGLPVAHHLLKKTGIFEWEQKILICRQKASWPHLYRQAGFKLIHNDNPAGGMLSSLHKAVLGVKPGISHLCICLADMPFISAQHLKNILNAPWEKQAVATQSGDYRGPPAIFRIQDLKKLPQKGEGGARSLLQSALFIPCPPQEIKDIDTQDDLEHLTPDK